MPFTLFHFGPALGFGLLLRRYLHFPTFIVANVIVDFEPLLVIVFGLIDTYPLHGYFHTFGLASILGIGLGYAMFSLGNYFQPLYKILLLKVDKTHSLKSFVLAGISGVMLHVALDSPLYSDIRPFYPLTENPLHNPALSLDVYGFCVLMGILGIVFYIGLLTLSAYNNYGKK